MRAYIVRRLLLAIPTFFLVTLIVFMLIRLMPGSVVDVILSQMGEIGDFDRPGLEHALGLDVPAHIQYGRWMGGLVRGDLGISLYRSTSVTEEIIARLPVTIELGILAVLTGQIIALPIGAYSALRQDTAGDYLARSFAIMCIAVPNFWLGTLIIVFFAIWWHWSPSMEYIPLIENPVRNLEQFILPGIVMGLVLSGTTMRMMRTMMLEVLRQDYIRTAWAKGLRERTVVLRHALKNALIPVVTLWGLQMPLLVGGSVIIEQIFCLPGVGRLLVQALTNRDYPIISGVNVFLAVFVLVINIVVDLTYGFLDPRVRFR